MEGGPLCRVGAVEGGVYRMGTTVFGAKYRLQRGLRPFVRDEVLRLPADRCGVYALWEPFGDDYVCLYVGKSEACIRRRLLSHLSDETNPELRRRMRMFEEMLEFGVAYTESVEETDALETEVIHAWKPVCNRVKLPGGRGDGRQGGDLR